MADKTGKIFHDVPTQLGTFEGNIVMGYLVIEVTVGGQKPIRFPLDAAADDTEIRNSLSSIVYQTGLVTDTVTVVVD